LNVLEELISVKLRFLYGLDIHFLASGLCLEDPLPWDAITDNLSKPFVIGTDFRGPEAAFKEAECEAVLNKLYPLLVASSERRTKHKKLVLRIHVRESDM